MHAPGVDLAGIARRLELEDLYTAYADCLDSDADVFTTRSATNPRRD